MSKEKYIKAKISKYYGRTLLDSKGERCRIIGCTYFNGTREIQIVVSKGFGASEKTEKLHIEEVDLDIKLESFSDAPKIDNSQIINNIPKEAKQESSIKLKFIKPLEMSEQTDDNLTGLRKHLFSAIRKLEGGTMKNEEAKAMAQVAQVIINSAKLEMEFKQLTNDKPIINMIG
jgi:hypothetical protein